MKKKKKVLKKGVVNFIILILLLIIGYCVFKIAKITLGEIHTQKIQDEYKLEKVEIKNPSMEDTYAKEFERMEKINTDFRGWITFESELVNLPFLQANDNDYYLQKNINREYTTHGSVFQDFMQTLDSKNITLYGHYVYNNAKLMFSPLAKLLNQENYEKNKIFYLNLEHSIRKYEVAAIIKYNLIDEPIYQQGDFTDEEFQTFLDYIKKNQLYNTGVDISLSDKTLVLQTCIRNEEDERLLIIGRQIEEAKVS